jgi:hypothetical protein
MAGKDKKPVGAENDETAKPETLEQVQAAKFEPPKAPEAPEGEDSFTKQMTFGQKTYDQQMKVEGAFAGLNRTDEISQLGGASKTEVDLAQMKIFSTERIGDELYAAIERGDTTKVESLAGMNSDRRMTEAQILVLLKAKRAHEEEEQIRHSQQMAFLAQEQAEEEKSKKKVDDDENYDDTLYTNNLSTADNQAGMYAAPTQDFSRCGFNEDGSYNDSWGGTYNTDGTYTDENGGTLSADGRYTKPDGSWEMLDGTNYNPAEGVINIETPATAPPASTPGSTPAAAPPQSTAVKLETQGEAQGSVATMIANQISLEQNNGTLPTFSPQTGAANDAQGAKAPATGTAGTTATTNAQGNPAATARERLGVKPPLMELSHERKVATAKTIDSIFAGNEKEQRLFMQWNRARNQAVGDLVTHGKGDVARTQITIEDYISYREKTATTPEDKKAVADMRSKYEAMHAANVASLTPAAGPQNESVALPQNQTQTAEAQGQAANAVGVNVANLQDTTAAGSTANATSGVVYDEYGGYYDDKGGYYDEFGGYYDDKGGYYDGMGGYYAKDGGYYDPNGGYQWPDGAYEDKYGNYVDKDGNLSAKDGTYLPKEEGKDFKWMLRENAKQENSANPFDPANPSPQAVQTFLNQPMPDWMQRKQAREAAASQPTTDTPNPDASNAGTTASTTTPVTPSTGAKTGGNNYKASSSFFASGAYIDDAVIAWNPPVWDPAALIGTSPLDQKPILGGPSLGSPTANA